MLPGGKIEIVDRELPRERTPNLRCASRTEVLKTGGSCTGRLVDALFNKGAKIELRDISGPWFKIQEDAPSRVEV